MSKENVQHCSHCGVEIHGDDYTLFDNEVFCPSCLERETMLCEHSASEFGVTIMRVPPAKSAARTPRIK